MKDDGLLNEFIQASGARREELYKEIEKVIDELTSDSSFETPSTTLQPVPLTLEQIKRIDGEAVVIPYSPSYHGGIGIVDLRNDRIFGPLKPRCLFGWPLSDYGKEYVAFSVNEVPDDK